MATMEQRPLSSRKKAELLRIEILRKSLCNRTGEEVYLVATPDEDESSQQHRPCDAILETRGVRFAVELTTIDSFMGQRSDDDRFRTVMGDLERRVGNIPDWVEITIDVGAIPTGYDWRQLSVGLEAWLLGNLQEFLYDRRVPVQIPDIPFTLWVRREHGWGEGRIVVMRHVPVDIEERRCAVISRALESKRGVLGHYKCEGYVTILLMEDYDFVLTNPHIICDAFQKVSPLELCADAIDDVYLIETATSPWTISPLKIGSQIFEEPFLEWPDAPGYPYVDT
jgi:hypothetical protein